MDKKLIVELINNETDISKLKHVYHTNKRKLDTVDEHHREYLEAVQVAVKERIDDILTSNIQV